MREWQTRQKRNTHITKGKKHAVAWKLHNTMQFDGNSMHILMQKCKMKSEKEKSPVQDAIFQKGM